VIIGGSLVVHPENTLLFPVFVTLALLFGILMIIPIGGADMPTVIALLNSYAGLSALRDGFFAPRQQTAHQDAEKQRQRHEDSGTEAVLGMHYERSANDHGTPKNPQVDNILAFERDLAAEGSSSWRLSRTPSGWP